jgi:hypothetical protein
VGREGGKRSKGRNGGSGSGGFILKENIPCWPFRLTRSSPGDCFIFALPALQLFLSFSFSTSIINIYIIL